MKKVKGIKIKKILSVIILSIFTINILPIGSVVRAADTRIPFVHISYPSPTTITSGGTVTFSVSADRATSLDIKTTDIGIAGSGVTLDKSVKVSGATATITLSNIQGPVGKMVSIALKAGIAKNEYGSSLMTAKSAAFTIVEPVKQPDPTPAPAQPTNPAPAPTQPKTNNTRINTPTQNQTNNVANITNETQTTTENTNTVQTDPINLDISDTAKPVLKIDSPSVSIIQTGESIEYVVTYSDDKKVANISLSPENVITYGFKADVSIAAEGNNKRIIRLTNIKGSLGGSKYIGISAGTSTDNNNNKDEGIKKSESFKIVADKNAEDNKLSDWIENPNTGR